MIKFKFKNLKEKYLEIFRFVLDSKKYIYFVMGIFFLFLFFGIFVKLPDPLSMKIFNYLKSIVLPTVNFNFGQMSWYLFSNNVNSNLFGLFGGIIFGIFSVFSGIVNGFVLGFVLKVSIVNEGILSIWKIFPHGIFEIPALFISLGLGLRLGLSVFKKREKGSQGELIKKSFYTYILLVVPLLIIAAIIEAVLIFVFK